MSKSVDRLLGVRAHPPQPQERPERAVAERPQLEVHRDRQAGGDAGAEPVLGDVAGRRRRTRRARRRASSGLPSTRIVPFVLGRTPAIVSASSRWPLPATPATATISPARTVSDTPFTAGGAAVAVGPEVLDLEHRRRLVGWRAASGWAVSKSWPIMSDASDCGVALGGAHGGDAPARAQDRDAVGDRHHLVQLVGDEDHRPSLGRDLAQRREERVGLVGREHRRRLVEDEDPRVLVERVEDLHPLLLADRRAARCAPAGRRGGGSARRARAPGSRRRPGRCGSGGRRRGGRRGRGSPRP